LGIIALAIGGVAPGNLGLLAATAILALLANAGVCGVFTNPHDRVDRDVGRDLGIVAVARTETGQSSARWHTLEIRGGSGQ
jgi:hypothetical protein